jgi:protein tyrosine phosphatase (PTP) superfamily phosphohydrolase (DUF442 family)
LAEPAATDRLGEDENKQGFTSSVQSAATDAERKALTLPVTGSQAQLADNQQGTGYFDAVEFNKFAWNSTGCRSCGRRSSPENTSK